MPALCFPDLEVHTLVDDIGSYLTPDEFFADLGDDEHRAVEAIPEAYDARTGRLRLSFHSYLVRTSERNVLVDTAIGTGKTIPVRPRWHQRTDDSWLRQLEAAGVRPGAVDAVVFSHLHLDHVGWNTVQVASGWAPTFSNASYLFVDAEFEYVTSPPSTGPHAAGTPVGDAVRHSCVESVDPIVRAGQSRAVASDYRLDNVVRLVPAPGHTPGHCVVEIGGPDPVAVVTGDLFHSPVQVASPRLTSYSDRDPDAAITSREAFLDRYADSGVLVLGSHFPGRSHGYIVRRGTGYEFV